MDEDRWMRMREGKRTQTRAGEWVRANEGGGMGAGKRERGRASANEGGGATAAAAATAGPPSPPFFIYWVFHLVRWQPSRSIPPSHYIVIIFSIIIFIINLPWVSWDTTRTPRKYRYGVCGYGYGVENPDLRYTRAEPYLPLWWLCPCSPCMLPGPCHCGGGGGGGGGGAPALHWWWVVAPLPLLLVVVGVVGGAPHCHCLCHQWW